MRDERDESRDRLREEVWQDSSGKVVRYNLAFINFFIYQGDNGRVLGYDVAHGHHHRHLKGKVEPIDFQGYQALVNRFLKEVSLLRKQGQV